MTRLESSDSLQILHESNVTCPLGVHQVSRCPGVSFLGQLFLEILTKKFQKKGNFEAFLKIGGQIWAT